MRVVGMNPPLNYMAHRSIINRVTYSHQANYQFLHTLGNDVYIYVFGDRVGHITVQGLAFAAACPNPTDPRHGIQYLDEWYALNRLAQREAPILLTIGTAVVPGFLIGVDGDLNDAQNRIMQFSLQLAVTPKKR
jgi:hypothetical protein